MLHGNLLQHRGRSLLAHTPRVVYHLLFSRTAYSLFSSFTSLLLCVCTCACIQQVKKILADDDTIDHEYLPIGGLPSFTAAAGKLIFGKDSIALKEGRVSTYVPLLAPAFDASAANPECTS